MFASKGGTKKTRWKDVFNSRIWSTITLISKKRIWLHNNNKVAHTHGQKWKVDVDASCWFRFSCGARQCRSFYWREEFKGDHVSKMCPDCQCETSWIGIVLVCHSYLLKCCCRGGAGHPADTTTGFPKPQIATHFRIPLLVFMDSSFPGDRLAAFPPL